MAAVARHEHHFMFAGDAAQRLDMVETDAVIETVPEASQERLHEGHEGVGVVGSDLLTVAARHQQGLTARQTLGTHLRRRYGTHRAGVQHAREDGATMGHVRADARGALAPEHGTPSAGDARGLCLRRFVVSEQTAQADRCTDLKHRETTVEGHLQDLAQRPTQHPTLGEPEPQPGALLLRRPPPIHRHRHEPDIEAAVGLQRLDETHEFGRGAAIDAAVEEAALRQQRQRGAHGVGASTDQPAIGRRQTVASADVRHQRDISSAAALEHIADRCGGRGDDLLQRVVGAYFRTHPERHQAPPQELHGTRSTAPARGGKPARKLRNQPPIAGSEAISRWSSSTRWVVARWACA